MGKVFVYIDETGDRGASATASPIFGMAALIVPEGRGPSVRSAVDVLRSDLGVPPDKVLSWKAYVKSHDRRRRAAEVLAGLSGVKVCYVYAKKEELRSDSYRNDKLLMYNYLAYKTYKSIVWACRNIGATEIVIRYGHVRHHDHSSTEDYIRREASRDPKVPNRLVSSMRWVSADRYRESQAADLFGGFLKAALWPSGEFDYTEPGYLLRVWHLIRNSETCAIPLGILSMPSNDVLTSEDWFPCGHCAKK